MSDRGIPASFRNMHFYGEHTYSFYSSDNKRVWCKFHFHTQQGIKNLSNEEADKINGMGSTAIWRTRNMASVLQRPQDFPRIR